MSTANSGLKIVSSGRNFFPKGAFFYSTKKIAELAKGVGYEGIEFLPTWRFVWEMTRYGRLLASPEMLASGHRDWRFDRVMEARIKSRPDWWFQVREKTDWLFPPSGICLTALQKFQKIYKVPVSVAWFADTKNFSLVMLELWSKKQGIDQKGLLKWLGEDHKNHGVVIDTAKIDSWLISNNLEDKRKALEELLPYTFEIHYRVKSNIRGVRLGGKKGVGELSDKTTENLFSLLKMGYRGRIVVEFGWPDLEGSPFGLIGEDIQGFKNLHRRIISLVKSA